MADAERKTPGGWLVAVCVLTIAILALNVDRQLFDTNFYGLFEATSLLAGDHPYRDFFEWGIPLQAAVSAAVQWLAGNRMAGEFLLIHWTFIVAGAALSFALGYQLTRSALISFGLALLALGALPDTPTFHYPKLFLYPLGVWLSWRYLDRPGPARALALGGATAAAFLFRHDHGVYLGLGAALAFVLARCASPSQRPWVPVARDAGVYAASVLVLLAPWLIVVQRSEGLAGYVNARAALYEMWSGDTPYKRLLTMNPVRLLTRAAPGAPRPGTISFKWGQDVRANRRAELERQFGLRAVGGPDEQGRWRYEVHDANALELNDLRLLVNDAEGVDWGAMEQRLSRLPTLERARAWQEQVTVLVPLALLASAGLALVRARRLGHPPPPVVWRLVLAATFLALVEARLLREPSYAHLVAPLTAAMATWFLTLRRPGEPSRHASWRDLARVTVAVALAALTAVTAFVTLQSARLFRVEHVAAQATTYRRLLVAPPIEAFARRDEIAEWTAGHDRAAWDEGAVPHRPEILLRYIHDCTRPDDRVLVTGVTPFQVGYLVGRPIGGGHVFWHHGWRTDPEQAARLLTLVQSQSIPFAYSTSDPLLDDLRAYPAIHRHFADHYRPLPGTNGRLLLDARRHPSSSFGPYDFPCFT